MPPTTQQEKLFAIVEFQERGKRSVSVVSRNWLEKKEKICAWPLTNGHTNLISHAVPEPSWKRYSCRLLKYSGEK